MKKLLAMLFLLTLSNISLAADENHIQQANASALMQCDSTKIESCMKGCVKQINPASTSVSASSKINKCVDACSTQGCQVAEQR